MILYHYTSMQTAIEIIKNSTLHMTNMAFMNDLMEVRHGIRMYERISKETGSLHIPAEVWRSFERAVPPWFVTCLSADDESFSQWNTYADGCRGVCLGFDCDALTAADCKIKKVVYDEAEQWRILHACHLSASITEESESETFTALQLGEIVECWSYFKQPAFASEQEYRVIRTVLMPDQVLLKRGLPPNDRIEYRSNGGKLIPFIKYAFNPQAIKCVKLGPAATHELNEDVFAHLLSRYGVNAEIKRSTVRC